MVLTCGCKKTAYWEMTSKLGFILKINAGSLVTRDGLSRTTHSACTRLKKKSFELVYFSEPPKHQVKSPTSEQASRPRADLLNVFEILTPESRVFLLDNSPLTWIARPSARAEASEEGLLADLKVKLSPPEQASPPSQFHHHRHRE